MAPPAAALLRAQGPREFRHARRALGHGREQAVQRRRGVAQGPQASSAGSHSVHSPGWMVPKYMEVSMADPQNG